MLIDGADYWEIIPLILLSAGESFLLECVLIEKASGSLYLCVFMRELQGVYELIKIWELIKYLKCKFSNENNVFKKKKKKKEEYVCVCVCVYICIYTHTHTHLATNDLHVNPGLDCKIDVWQRRRPVSIWGFQ